MQIKPNITVQSLILCLLIGNTALYANEGSQEQKAALEIQLMNSNAGKAQRENSARKEKNAIMFSHPEYPAACDPFPIPTNPEGPTVVEKFSWFEDAFTLTAWRYACDEENSWVIFTILPDPGSKPFICSDNLILVQDGFQSAFFTLTQDPAGQHLSQCSDVVVKSSYALIDRFTPSPVVDLRKAFEVFWDLGNNDQKFLMFEYNPDEYDLKEPDPPELSNDMGINGLFYDPANPGHGFDFNMTEYGLIIYYYGHIEDGERLWLISHVFDGTVEYDVPINLPMVELTNGEFNNPVNSTTGWGTLTLTFTDCDSGVAILDGTDGKFEMHFVRGAGLKDIECN